MDGHVDPGNCEHPSTPAYEDVNAAGVDAGDAPLRHSGAPAHGGRLRRTQVDRPQLLLILQWAVVVDDHVLIELAPPPRLELRPDKAPGQPFGDQLGAGCDARLFGEHVGTSGCAMATECASSRGGRRELSTARTCQRLLHPEGQQALTTW